MKKQRKAKRYFSEAVRAAKAVCRCAAPSVLARDWVAATWQHAHALCPPTLPPQQVMDWFCQLTSAIDFCHSHRVLHRDLKPGNIFLTATNQVKLGDFGIARVLENTMDKAQTVAGTPYFMSPEVCENKPYGPESDMWALGCILYELCTLRHPFEASNLLGLVFKIVTVRQRARHFA